MARATRTEHVADLTLQRVVDGLKPKRERYFVHDATTSGYFVIVNPKGTKSYGVRYRWHGRSRRFIIGNARHLTATRAAAKAAAILALADQANADPSRSDLLDPALQHVKRHAEDGTTAGDRTFKAAAARWVARLERDGRSARWIGEARRMVGLAMVKRGTGVRYFPPSFLSKAVGDITRADAAAVLSKVAAPYMRNKVRMVIGAVWRHEADLGLFPDDRPSPIARVKRTTPVKRQRALGETDGTEWKRLGRAWRTLTNEIGEVNDTRRTQADFVVLALLTGARKDALRLRTWGDVDFGAAILRVRPEHKGVSSVVLGDAAVNYLRRMHDAAGAPPDDAFIFPGQRAGRRRSVESAPPKPLTRPDGPFWNALRERANVPDLRLHDLRRSFRSTAGEIGVPVGAAEKLIGHSLAGIVGVYDVVSALALKKAADTTAAAVADRLGMGDLTTPPESRGVLPMKRRATR